ncbi:hypothetical protein SAMN05443248_2298 [Bradyrhizobium erythrophlei]|uniref:Uncharacterized protein n=1 Tax=Bradyrhizobium erythrophlei TaxID=1437360 RepID=A0A1M5LQ80_9BRAD|nr:hypothetical protein SAMN05443248_2298 [Bradyrhizobium erythrophlei]
MNHQCLNDGGELPLPLWERVGVRGFGPSTDLNPSPGSHLSMRSDLSHKGRGENRLAIAHRGGRVNTILGISRFRVRCFASPRNDSFL